MSKQNDIKLVLKGNRHPMSFQENIKLLAMELAKQTEQKLSSAQRCRHVIIQAIKQSLLVPGQRLIEADLCAALSVSRTPLREALAALRADGVIEADGQTMRVRTLHWRDINDLYDMRSLLEGAAAKYAARHAGKAEKQVLQSLIHTEEALITKTASPRALAEHNRQFHHAIMQSARNDFLRESLEKLAHLFILIGDTAYQLKDRQSAAHDQHKAIYEAIERGDEAAAQKAMEDHLQDALAARLRLLSQDQDVKA